MNSLAFLPVLATNKRSAWIASVVDMFLRSPHRLGVTLRFLAVVDEKSSNDFASMADESE